MTIFEAVQKAKKCLGDNHVPDCGIDALILLQSVCGIDRARYYAHGDEELSDADADLYFEKIALRAGRVPLQQITGEQYFCGLKFIVTEDVLCPRPETELLVEEALKHLKASDRVLDLCTGSGCVAISILCLAGEEESTGSTSLTDPEAGTDDRFSGSTGWAGAGDSCVEKRQEAGVTACGCDLSRRALEIARKNAEINHVSDCFCLIQGDLYEGITDRYDMIVSNPPYIASGEIPSLMPEVRDHEPRMALDGGADGLDFYRRILKGSGSCLKQNGWLIVEIGCDQGEEVRSMFLDYGYESVQVIKDLAGLDRIVSGQYKGVSECLIS